MKRYVTFRFRPNKHTGFAFGTLILMTILYTLGTLADDFSFIIGSRTIGTEFFWLVFLVMMGTLFTGVYVPLSHVTKAIGGHLDQLGLRRDNLWLALGLSVVLAALYVPRLLAASSGDLLLHLLYNLFFGIWQVVFVYGWLQLRFEEAFGAIPALLLAGVSFALLQAATVEPTQILPLLIVGLGQAFAFSLVRSLFILWPIPWSVSYTAVSLEAGLELAWGRVILFGVLAVLIYVMVQWVYEEALRDGKLKAQPD